MGVVSADVEGRGEGVDGGDVVGVKLGSAEADASGVYGKGFAW